MIAKTSEFIVKKDKLETVKEAINKFVRIVHVSEPGTRIYVSLQEEANEFKFLHLMIFESRGAEEKHQKAGYTREFVDILYPNCKSEPVFRNYTYVAGL